MESFTIKKPGSYLLSHSVTRIVPSAVEGLTSVFGMGTGVSPLLSLPGILQKIIYGQVSRSISTGKLNTSLHLHFQPINPVVYGRSSVPRTSSGKGMSSLEGGLMLICFQHLSFPNAATQLCHWRDN